MSHATTARITIGVLAKEAEVAIDTIRFYEREGLLPPPVRSASGYRQYDKQSVEQVRFIRRAKYFGFTLEEIRDLLSLSCDHDAGVQGVNKRARERLAEIDERIAQLTAMRDGLARLIDACPGEGSPDCCPIIQSMQRGDIPVVEFQHTESMAKASAIASCCHIKGKPQP
jgi:MerR family copper efflux transcriptional regulator